MHATLKKCSHQFQLIVVPSNIVWSRFLLKIYSLWRELAVFSSKRYSSFFLLDGHFLSVLLVVGKKSSSRICFSSGYVSKRDNKIQCSQFTHLLFFYTIKDFIGRSRHPPHPPSTIQLFTSMISNSFKRASAKANPLLLLPPPPPSVPPYVPHFPFPSSLFFFFPFLLSRFVPPLATNTAVYFPTSLSLSPKASIPYPLAPIPSKPSPRSLSTACESAFRPPRGRLSQ